MTTLESPLRRAEVDEQAGLFITELAVHYGDVVAVDEVSLSVRPGEIVALLGANGAGKSSLLNAISGLVPIAHGSVFANGQDLTHEPAQRRAALVAHVPEGRRLFTQHSVAENLMLAAFGLPREERQAHLDHVVSVLPRLAELSGRQAFGLSGGEQQMVALGRGLMGPAGILMIDELSLGLAPIIANQFAETLLVLKARGYAILLVEQYVTLALRVADRIVTLERGRVAAVGTPDDLRREAAVLQDAYLGGASTALLEQEADHNAAVKSPAARAEPRPARVRTLVGPVLAILGAASFVGASFAPWLDASNGLTSTSIDAWGYQWIWGVAPAICSAVLVVLALVRIISRRPLGLWLKVLGLLGALGLFAFTLARSWLFTTGIPGADLATYSRAWGLLVVIHGGEWAIVGAVAMALERRRPSGAASEAP